MLDRLAQTIVDALGFGVAVVNLARADGALEVVAVAGHSQARTALLGTTAGAETWDRMLQASESWGALRFIDHRSDGGLADVLSWAPDLATATGDDAWHPEDALFAPLVAEDGSRLGVLSVDLPRDGRRPAAVTCRALEAFAMSTALAIEHATLRERAEVSETAYRKLASQDPLTGIANRSACLEQIERAVSDQQANQCLTALVFLDLDGFKQVNDVHSHAAGDHVLQQVARRLRSSSRPGDRVSRWGGDEFLVMLDNLRSESDCLQVVERLLAAVAEPIFFEGRELRVTASIGITLLSSTGGASASELVRQADAAMYTVKRSGRDGIALHHPSVV